MLHLLSTGALQSEMVERIAPGDDVVLQQGVVWAALIGHADNAKLQQLMLKNCRIFVLQEMLTLNGIEISRLLPVIVIIDYPGLVELTVKNPVIQSWF